MLDLVFYGTGVKGLESILYKLTTTLPDIDFIISKVPDSVAIRIGDEEKDGLGLLCNVNAEIDPDSDTLHITFDNADAGQKTYGISVTDVVNAFTKTVSNTDSYKSGNVVVAFDPDSTSFELIVAVSSEYMMVLANITNMLDDKTCAVIAGVSKGA